MAASGAAQPWIQRRSGTSEAILPETVDGPKSVGPIAISRAPRLRRVCERRPASRFASRQLARSGSMEEMASKIVVDRSRFPLVIQTMQGGYGIDDLDEMLATYDELLKGTKRYTIIVYFPQLPSMNPVHRQRMAAWWLPRKELV